MTHAGDRVIELALQALPRCGGTAVIAIDGRAGSGKSTLAIEVAERSGCPIVHLEDLYGGWDGLRRGIDSLAVDVLEPLSAGRDALVPQWDWLTRSWRPPLPLTPPALLVVEGVGAAALRVAEYVSVAVWLECDETTRRTRALSREADGAAFAPQWAAWAQLEESLLAADATGTRADIVIDTSVADVPCA